MKKMKFPTLVAMALGVILMIAGSVFTVQDAEACSTKKTWQRGAKIAWDCVGTTGNTCGRCKRY